MRIAIDAMGGDFAPREVVRGAVDAARSLDGIDKIYLVGDESAIKEEISLCCGSGQPACIEIRHAAEVIGMDESPAQGVRKKKDSSISRAMDLVRDGEADAVVSAGNTGAIVVAATLKLRTLQGVERPAIAVVMPTKTKPFVLIDGGANVDTPANLLFQFGVMGGVYSKLILGQSSPAIGLLSIGTEEMKGNEVTLEAYKLLSASKLNFKGNIEGNVLFTGEIDVVVCDGFVGNIVLKSTESIVKVIIHWMKQEFKQNIIRIIGALLLTGAGKAIKKKLDPEMYAGAPLLGVNGIVIKTHGSSSAKAVFNAIRVARDSVVNHVNEMIIKGVSNSGDIN